MDADEVRDSGICRVVALVGSADAGCNFDGDGASPLIHQALHYHQSNSSVLQRKYQGKTFGVCLFLEYFCLSLVLDVSRLCPAVRSKSSRR